MFLLIQTNGTDFGWPGAALPVSLTTGPTETWIEQTIVIPAGATTLQAGVEWNTVQNGEVVYLNDFEITKLSGNATPEYQYHLKDHLGNVRTTFTTVVPITQMTATFESGAQSSEAGQFLNYPDSPHLNSTISNAHTGTYSEYLRGANVSHDQVGVAKSFSVMPGDSLKIKAFVKYSTPTGTPSNLAGFATALLSAFNFTAPGGGETGTGRSAINTWGGLEATGYGDGSSDNTHPKLFVTIVLFDRNYTQVDVAYQQVTSSGAAISAAYRVKQPGYAFMYISNEHPYLVDAYFDDVLMQLTPNAVVQQDDYYPFGLAFNSYQRENGTPNQFKFNGKEEITELDLNWYDYGARMYDATIGRWFVIDPLSEANRRWSPYRYAYNNPLRFIDPDGMFEVFINGSKANDATTQLDASTSLNVTRDANTGKLSATGEAKTRKDRKLLAAINSKDVKVNITADGAKTTTDPSTGGNLLMVGGAFMGNTVGTETTTRTEVIPSEDGMCGTDGAKEVDVTTTSSVVTAEQHVNPDVLGAIDAANGNSGKGMLHETLEAYGGGLISLKKGVSSPAAGQAGSVYNKAHRRAPSQGATITGTYWDAAGNLLPSEAGATRVEMKSKGRVIMTYP